eukprot:2145175-Pyramimonas_sp.AAC.1
MTNPSSSKAKPYLGRLKYCPRGPSWSRLSNLWGRFEETPGGDPRAQGIASRVLGAMAVQDAPG